MFLNRPGIGLEILLTIKARWSKKGIERKAVKEEVENDKYNFVLSHGLYILFCVCELCMWAEEMC